MDIIIQTYNKHVQLYNHDMPHPGEVGTVYHRLQLELYGVGGEDKVPLGSWILPEELVFNTTMTDVDFVMDPQPLLVQMSPCLCWTPEY